MLFLFKLCEYNNNKMLAFKNLSFLLKTLIFIIIRPFKFIVENESNKNNFNMNYFKDISNRKKSTLTFKTFKKEMIKKFNFIDIVEINASIYYYLIRNKENKLFSLTINEIYDIFNEFFEIISQLQRDNRILINELYLYDFKIKYKKYCKLYISKNV